MSFALQDRAERGQTDNSAHSAANPDFESMPDTPANRALFPEETPQALFQNLGAGAFYADDEAIILNMDVRDGLRRLASEGVQVDCIVTSPPFYGQRDYGFDDQIGLEDHPSKYLSRLLEVFELCRPILRPTGSLWVNLGDTYWSGKGEHRSGESKQGARRFGKRPQDGPGDGYWTRPKQLLLIPHRFAALMQGSGWLLRNDNVWIKPNPVPDQVRDRCSVSHEYVFHFTKERWYYFNKRSVGTLSSSGKTHLPPRDTWEVDTARNGGSDHRAAFSEELLRIPVLSTTPERGIVLDPFSGSGTSMAFANRNGFRSIGIDMSTNYCNESLGRLRSEKEKRRRSVEDEEYARQLRIADLSKQMDATRSRIASLSAELNTLMEERDALTHEAGVNGAASG